MLRNIGSFSKAERAHFGLSLVPGYPSFELIALHDFRVLLSDLAHFAAIVVVQYFEQESNKSTFSIDRQEGDLNRLEVKILQRVIPHVITLG